MFFSLNYSRIKIDSYDSLPLGATLTFHNVVILGKSCVHYILASSFLSLKDSTCETKKNIFYFTSRALFVLEKIEF